MNICSLFFLTYYVYLPTDGCGKAFVACLKEASPLWLMMVGEMWAGSMTAREVREPGLELQASRNVMLLDAVLKRLDIIWYPTNMIHSPTLLSVGLKFSLS